MKRILVVDDEKDIVGLMEETLMLEGYIVKTALSGKECLAVVEDFEPDVIFLDLMMPVMDGREVLRKLHDRNILETTEVIILSAKLLDEDDEIWSMQGNPVHYIRKPISLAGLLQKIRELG